MTDAELRDAAWRELTLTTDTYPAWRRKGFPAGTHWAKAKGLLDQIGLTTPPASNVFWREDFATQPASWWSYEYGGATVLWPHPGFQIGWKEYAFGVTPKIETAS